jgi:hypothetical protein
VSHPQNGLISSTPLETPRRTGLVNLTGSHFTSRSQFLLTCLLSICNPLAIAVWQGVAIGFLKVLAAMPDPSPPCGQATPYTALRLFQRWLAYRLDGLQPSSTPLGTACHMSMSLAPLALSALTMGKTGTGRTEKASPFSNRLTKSRPVRRGVSKGVEDGLWAGYP